MGDYGGVNGFDTSQSPQRSCLPQQHQFLNLLGDGHLLLFLRFAFSFRCHVQVRFGFAHPRLPVRAASIFSPRLPSAPHLIIFPSSLPVCPASVRTATTKRPPRTSTETMILLMMATTSSDIHTRLDLITRATTKTATTKMVMTRVRDG